MPFHDSLSSIETQACALSDSLGGEEWFEDMGLDIGRNTGTAVANLDHDTGIILIRAQPKFALAVHGVNRVINDVGPNLVQFAPKGVHQKRNRLILTLDLH